MLATEFAKLVKGARPGRGGWWKALCPAHDDKRPSLSFRDTDQGLNVRYHRGCALEAIVAQVNMPLQHFVRYHLRHEAPGMSKGTIDRFYDYRDEHRELLYQAVRYE